MLKKKNNAYYDCPNEDLEYYKSKANFLEQTICKSPMHGQNYGNSINSGSTI
jgi:hypothetical protein